MQLVYLCDMEVDYREEPLYDDTFILVRPYGSEDGTVTGSKLSGKVRWVNHPHRRSDVVMMPDIDGVLQTEDGALILFSQQGRTLPTQDQKRRMILQTTFEAEDQRYVWLNNTFCLFEGVIDLTTGHVQGRIFACEYDFI
jgi:hypothetical protein